jgi:hypothetical protein
MPEHSYDIYEWMVVTVARVGRRIPAVDLALRDAISHLAAAIPLVDDPEARGSAHGRAIGRRAYTHVVALGQHLGCARDDASDACAGGASDGAIALRAILGVLDALAPFVGIADRAMSSLAVVAPPALMPYAELEPARGERAAAEPTAADLAASEPTAAVDLAAERYAAAATELVSRA